MPPPLARALTVLTAGALASCASPVVPGDAEPLSATSSASASLAANSASILVFDSDRGGNRDLWAVRPDGSGLRRLTDHPGFDVLADVSRDGRRIVFQSDREGPFIFRVYVMDADGTNVRRLTTAAAFESSPDWSPDGRRVALDRSVATGNQEVFIVHADGTGEVRLTDSPGFDGQPDWSPDGRRIVFSSARDDNREIYLMNADGTGVERLTAHAAADEAPAWSPDGRRIAFHSTRDGVLGIYVMNADGGEVRRLTDAGVPDASPAWSPDGRWIAFHRRVTPTNPELYVMRADGTGEAIRVTGGSGWDGFADWARRLNP